jgi:hypothetical protein
VLVMPSSLLIIAPESTTPPADVPRTQAKSAAPRKARAPRVADAANEPLPRPAALPSSEDTADMLVQIAKDHQARTLESIRLGLAAALDYARDRARTPMPVDPEKNEHGAKPEDNLLAAVGTAAGYRAEALELVKANFATTLDYARDLAEATTAADFVELSSRLARKQCELMLKQAAVLQSFAQGLTKPGEG